MLPDLDQLSKYRSSGLEASNRTQSLVDFITTTSGFRFSYTQRVLHPPIAQRLVGEIVHVQPGHQPGRQRRLPWPDSTHRTEAPRQEVPINLRREPHQRMAKVDDLLQRWTEQIILTIVARLAHGFPRQRISPSKQTRTAKIRNPKTQEFRHPHPAFLQNRLLAQVKSPRSINRFRILHGRLINVRFWPKADIGLSAAHPPRWFMSIGSNALSYHGMLSCRPARLEIRHRLIACPRIPVVVN